MNMNAGAYVGRMTVADVVNAARDILAAVEAGTLRPDDVERRAVDACRELFGVVGSGSADPLWSLHGDVCRQFLECGDLSSGELSEWLAVQRRREAEDGRSQK